MFRLVPRIHGALVEGERFVGNYAVHGEVDGVPEALAARAGAVRTVEAEQDRLGRVEFAVTRFAGEPLAEAQMLIQGSALKDHLARLAIADLDGIDEPLVQFRLDDEAIDEHEDGLR